MQLNFIIEISTHPSGLHVLVTSYTYIRNIIMYILGVLFVLGNGTTDVMHKIVQTSF